MAQVKQSTVKTELTVLLELTEEEVRALDGIFGYNVDVFLKVFYERMGSTYVKPFENGVRSLHSTIRSSLTKPLEIVDKARSGMNQAIKSHQ